MDKLAAFSPAMALESFTQAVPSPTMPLQEQRGGSVLKPDLELFHSASTPYKNGSEADAYAASQYEKGLAEGQRKAADVHAATIAVMQDSVTALQESFTARLEDIKNQNIEAVTQIFEELFPALSRHSFTIDFKNILEKIIDAEIAGLVHITCAQDDIKDIQNLISACPRPESFKLTANENRPQQINMSWENGGSCIDYSHVSGAASEILSKHFSPKSID